MKCQQSWVRFEMGRAAVSAVLCVALFVASTVAPVAGGAGSAGDASATRSNGTGSNGTSGIGATIPAKNGTDPAPATDDGERPVVTASTATGGGPGAVPAGVWSNLFRDTGQTGVNPRADAPSGVPRIRWSRTVSGTPSGVVASEGGIYVNVADGSLTAIDRRSGSVEWANGSGVQGFAPVVAGDVVVTYPLTGGLFVARQNLTAYDATTGREVWDVTPEGADSFITAPVVADGTVYLGYDRRVTAYDTDTGRSGWATQLGAQPRAPLLARHGHVYVREANGNLSAFDAGDGSVAWRGSLDATGFGAQAATGRSVYAVDDTSVVAFDPADGSRNWSVGGFDRTGALVAGNDTLYASVDNGTETGVVALDARTGERRWFQPRVDISFHDTGRMTATDESLYVAASDGTLYALDRTDGTEQWAWTPDAAPAYPTPINDSLYVVAGDTLYALEDRSADGGITVRPSPPTANATAELNVSQVVRSLGGPTEVSRVEWSFGDGGTATGIRVFHRFAEPGSYEVTATVTTVDGFRFRVDRSVDVVDPDVSEPAITLVAASPPGQVPGHPLITKNYTVGAVAPTGVDRVAFEVRTGGEVVETLVDRNGTDGWGAAVPTTYGPDTVVRIRVVAASGRTVTRTVDVGVVRFGSFVEYVLDNGELELAPGGRYVVGVTLPPTGRIGFERDLALLGKAEVAFLAQARLGGRFAPPRNTLGGQAELDVQTPGVRVAGSGAVTGISRQGVAALEFRKVTGSFQGEGGGYREIDLPEPVPDGISAVVFYGGYVSGSDLVWANGTWWPPAGGTASVGLELSGSASAGVSEGLFELFALEASTTGRAGIDSTFPRLERNVTLAGEATVSGRVILVFSTISFEATLFEAGVTASSLRDRAAATTRLRRKVGETPASPATVSTAAAGTTGGVGTRTGRLTTDPYADGSPSVAGTPGGFLLAWDRQPADRGVLDGHEITVRRYADGGFGAPTNLTDDRRMDLDPSVATGTNGSRLVAWTRLNRSFANASTVEPAAAFRATGVALAARNGSGADGWSAPRPIAGDDGAAFSPRVASGDGRYLVAWRVDGDGNFSTRDDRSVRYATYEPGAASLGPVRTIADARRPRVAGNATALRLVAVRPANTTGDDGRLVVRNLAAGTERTVPVADLVDVATTPGSVTWLRGPADNRSLQYVAGDRRGRVGTAPVAAPTDVGAVTRETADGRQVTVITFRGRTVDGNSTSTPAVFYRARRGGNWTPARQVSPETASLTFGQAATGGGPDGFLTAFVGRNVSDDDQLNDLFYARHTYGAALNLSARPTASVSPGNATTVRYAVTNGGTRTARNVTVVLADGSTTLARRSLAPLAPGERAPGAATVEAPTDGTLTVRAATTTPTLPGTNATVQVVTSRPELSIDALFRRPGARNVTYAVSVVNDGDAPAGATSLAVTNDRRTVATADLPALAPGEGRTATLTVPVADLNRYRPTRLRVDPEDRVAEIDETDGRRVVATSLPDLFVAPGTTTVVDGEAIEVAVGNRGPGAANVTVAVSAANRTVRRRTTIDGAPSGEPVTRTVRVGVSPLSLSADETVLVRARADAPETNTTDNLVAVTVPPSVVDPVIVPPTPANDPDDDGLYEDVNGDGRVGFIDVVDLLFADFAAIDDDPDRRAAADFDGDGTVGFLDVVTLLFEL